MWPRTAEIALACWLAVSPFVFGHPAGATFLWLNDFMAAALVATISLLSFRRSLSRLHLLHFATGLWLIGSAFLQTQHPPGDLPGALQNHVLVGALLIFLALVPSHGEELPPKWRGFYER